MTDTARDGLVIYYEEARLLAEMEQRDSNLARAYLALLARIETLETQHAEDVKRNEGLKAAIEQMWALCRGDGVNGLVEETARAALNKGSSA